MWDAQQWARLLCWPHDLAGGKNWSPQPGLCGPNRLLGPAQSDGVRNGARATAVSFAQDWEGKGTGGIFFSFIRGLRKQGVRVSSCCFFFVGWRKFEILRTGEIFPDLRCGSWGEEDPLVVLEFVIQLCCLCRRECESGGLLVVDANEFSKDFDKLKIVAMS
ncbi:hypothetical protein BHM03_00000475 [Ensete ventricosum]|nr:hypothetical protein BHM03_00000475 [Ensete ventricosum]